MIKKKKQKKYGVLLSITLILVGVGAIYLVPNTIFSQPSQKQQGEIGAIDLKSKEGENTYKKVQERTVKKIEDLREHYDILAEGTTTKIKKFDSYELNYLAASLLFCSLKTGACPFVLDTLLEVDLINSAISGKVGCPNVKLFWKQWISNDMEKRLSYDLGVGQFAKSQAFKKNQRPKYLKCKETITEILKEMKSASTFFIDRYGDKSPPRKATKKTLSLIKTIEKKIPNIFYKTKVKG